mgnify:CR=1 FL=1
MFTSDTVFVGLLREGEILLFVRWSWMPHSLMYMEPDAWAVNGKVNFGRELTHALFSPLAMASRCGSESPCEIPPGHMDLCVKAAAEYYFQPQRRPQQPEPKKDEL